MEKSVQIFKNINLHSSTKSSVPPLHKFIIQNLDLFFSLFWELKLSSPNSAVYLLTCQYSGRMEKIVLLECRIAFCRLFVELRRYAMKGKSEGNFQDVFFHFTLECLYPYVPITSFRLMALRNKLECQCYSKTNITTC